MLKVLVVDDEKLVGLGVSEFVNEVDGFEVIGIARDGLDAIEKIEHKEPDIVITDIKMPRMNGTELVKYLNTHFPSIRKVILSGFDDFEYARSAMVNGAVDYLLKPLDDVELVKVLTRLQRDILLEAEKKRQRMRLKIKLNQSLPLLRDQFILDLLNGKYTSLEYINDRLKYFESSYEFYSYFVMIVGINNFIPLIDKKGEEEANLLSFSIRNIAEEIVGRHTSFLSCAHMNNMIFIVSMPQENHMKDVNCKNEILTDVYQNLLQHIREDFTIAAGKAVEGIHQLKAGFDNAQDVLRFRFYSKQSTILQYEEKKENPFSRIAEDMLYSCVEKCEHAFDNCIKTGSTGKFRIYLENLCACMEDGRLHPEDAVKFLLDLYTRIQLRTPEMKKALSDLYPHEFSYIKAMEKFDTLEGMITYTERFYSQIITKIIHNLRNKDKKLVEVVKEYVHKHYHEKITLQTIAGITYLNPNYFCEMFKSQTGENFVEYLTRVRIEKAKLLLKNVTMKTYEVSQKVGYENPDYFNKVFKKVVGVTPGQYRDSNG